MNPLYEYKNDLISIYSIFEFGRNLLTNIPPEEYQQWNRNASYLAYHQAVTSAGVLLNYLPESPINSDFKDFGPSFVAAQGRMLKDNFISIIYLLEDVDDSVLEFKELVWDQAIARNRFMMVNQINAENERLGDIEQFMNRNEQDIRDHDFFDTLEAKIQNNCAKGFTDKIYKDNVIVDKYNIDESVFWSAYQHYSQFIHSTAFSTDQLTLFLADQRSAEAIGFIKTQVRNYLSLLSLTSFVFIEEFKINHDIVPTTIFQEISMWFRFYQNKENEGAKSDEEE